MPFEWFIALRYLRAGRAQTALILTAVSSGVAVIVFLSALMSGLQVSLIDKTLGSQPHITLHPAELVARPLVTTGMAAALTIEKSPRKMRSIDQWPSIVDQLEHMPDVIAVSPTVTGAAFATRGTAQEPVILRAAVAERSLAIVDIRLSMRGGRFAPIGSDVVIGTGLADLLGVTLGDKIRLSTPDHHEAVVSVVGLFSLGNKEVDDRWVLASLRQGQTLFDLPGGASAIEVRVGPVFEAETIAASAADRTGLQADSWMKLNAQLLVALRSQSSSKYMIEFFVVVAVALGIASVLIVSVVQKSREIGIMRAVGTPRRSILIVFLVEGAIVGMIGSLIGSAMGAGLAAFFEGLARNADGTPAFPIDLNVTLFLTAGALATGTGLLAAVVPARRAARLDPAEAIRGG
jgi:lipoprotein-releasing system permease protein